MTIKEFLDKEFKNLEYYIFDDEWMQDLRDDFAKQLNVYEDKELYEEFVNTFHEEWYKMARETIVKIREMFEKLKEELQ